MSLAGLETPKFGRYIFAINSVMIRLIKKVIINISVVSVALFYSNPASASNAANGYITGFVTLSSGGVFFFQDGALTGTRPACDTGGIPQRWAIDATTPTGQALLSILITAKVTRQIVKITGAGTCPPNANSELPGIIVTDNVQ